jgi:hypothetical protein
MVLKFGWVGANLLWRRDTYPCPAPVQAGLQVLSALPLEAIQKTRHHFFRELAGHAPRPQRSKLIAGGTVTSPDL